MEEIERRDKEKRRRMEIWRKKKNKKRVWREREEVEGGKGKKGREGGWRYSKKKNRKEGVE